MEDLYSIHPSIPRSTHMLEQTSPIGEHHSRIWEERGSTTSTLSESLKEQIAGHPRYPSLVSAYIDCRKVGAPPELACMLEEMGRENYANAPRMDLGVDPLLDEFMESYCQVLIRYKEELSRPFDEATSFLSRIEMQLSDLCKSSSSTSSTLTTAGATTNDSPSDEVGGSSEEVPCQEEEVYEDRKSSSQLGDREVKEMLLKKYSSCLSSLRKEFLKMKKKKGKLPKDSRQALLDWWNAHTQWPYPTEEEKTKLAETTGLDQKQINNWFINQRKRHWKPSEGMQIALLQSASGGAPTATSTEIYFDPAANAP